MSDSEDWENAVDDALVDKPKEDDNKNQFVDEDKVDSDDEANKKKTAVQEEKKTEPAKPKKEKKDYDKMFEARNPKAKAKSGAAGAAGAEGMSKTMQGELLSREAEADITEQLFAADINTEASSLLTEKNY